MGIPLLQYLDMLVVQAWPHAQMHKGFVLRCFIQFRLFCYLQNVRSGQNIRFSMEMVSRHLEILLK